MYIFSDEEIRKNFYKHVDPRRRQELLDSRMIMEDPRAMSNCPTKGFQKQYKLNDLNSNSPWNDDEIGDKR